MPVDGNRRYAGPGLGQEGLWRCPSCGEDNTGLISQGCVRCGAGKPGYRAEAPPPPPASSEPQAGQGDVADYWASQHPEATVAAAYRAGYVAGIQAARAAQSPPPTLPAEGKVPRTILAALVFFRDQVLAAEPEEVATGEWCSAREVTALITQLQQEEAVHA